MSIHRLVSGVNFLFHLITLVSVILPLIHITLCMSYYQFLS